MGFFSSIGNAVKNVGGGILGSILPGSSGGGISSAIGGLLGNVLGSSAKSLGGIGTDYLANKYIGQPNAERAFAQEQASTAKQYERTKEMFQNRYKWTMEDMKRSGLNPILAVSSGFNVSGGPSVSKSSGFQATSPYGAGGSSALSLKKSDTETSKKAVNQAQVK